MALDKLTKVILYKNSITGRYECFRGNQLITYLTSGETFILIDENQTIRGRLEHNGDDYYWISNSGLLQKDLYDGIEGYILVY